VVSDTLKREQEIGFQLSVKNKWIPIRKIKVSLHRNISKFDLNLCEGTDA